MENISNIVENVLRKHDPQYFQPGERVHVNGRAPNDNCKTGRYGTFLRYVPTGHGNMARVALDNPQDAFEKDWIFHPESLDKVIPTNADPLVQISDTGRYKVQVIADSSGEWCSNGLTFTTVAEAEEYARDLSARWTMVRDRRVVQIRPDLPGGLLLISQEGVR